jgi:hypothetical protein
MQKMKSIIENNKPSFQISVILNLILFVVNTVKVLVIIINWIGNIHGFKYIYF